MAADDRINRDEFMQNVWDQLNTAINDGLLDEDQMQAILAILEPAVERQRLREEHGGPTQPQIESN